jgi:ketosteroid isomerase-like protein
MFVIYLLSGGMLVRPVIANPEPPSPILLADQSANQLTEGNIRQVLATIDKSINQKDIEGVLKFVAPFVYSEITVESNEGTQITSLDGKDEFRDLLQAIYARVKNSNMVNQQIKIDITAGGELGIAKITTMTALTTEAGNRYYASSTDTFRFAWLNNQPTIVSMTIKGWLAERPAEQ